MRQPSFTQAPVAYPMAFGHWHVRHDHLECRLPRKTVAVRAPGALLAEVLALCNGQLAWKEVAAALGQRWTHSSVDAFLRGLLHEGALVEAGEALAGWTDLGQLPSIDRRVASPNELPALSALARERLRAGSGARIELPTEAAQGLADLLRERQSHRTFADRPLSAGELTSILWAAHGVARSARDAALGSHRTIPSGGNMHAAHWFVFVLRELPDPARPIVPGLYEARFHLEGGATLDELQAGAEEAWRALGDPRVLRYASALVLPLSDVSVPARKYGNRATMFAQLEVGQSLQNAQLMATALDAAAMVRGDTNAQAVLEVLGPHLAGIPARWLALPALVAGARPTLEQVDCQKSDRRFDIGSSVRLGTGGFAFTAGPVFVGNVSHYASGRATDPQLALRKAEAEAWERQGWAGPGVLQEGRWKDIESPLDPRSIVAYAPAQHQSLGFPFKPFSARRRYAWKAAVDVHSGMRVHIPAECVYALAALPPRQRRAACTSSSTSGVAAWTDAEGALSRATLELLERDAFLRQWLAATAPARLDPESLPAQARIRVGDLQAAGHRVVLSVLPAWVPVVSVFVQAAARAFTAITAAAAFDAETALLKALDEAEGRAAHARAFPAKPLASASQVRSIEEVNRYYQTPRFCRSSDFYASSDHEERWPVARAGWCADWQSLLAKLAELGLPLLAADLTPAGACVDQGRTPLHVVRALVPGLLPIWFQHGLEPAGLPAFRDALHRRGRQRSALVHPFT